MSTTQDRLKAEWGTSDAPHDYGIGRKCTQGKSCETFRQTGIRWQPKVGVVRRYKVPDQTNKDGTPKVLLCEPCEKKRVEAGDTVEEFTGVRKPGRAVAFPLPKLKEFRKAYRDDGEHRDEGLTQAELAEKVGCGSEHIMNIEQGHSNCSSQTAGNIARALGTETRVLRREG